MDSATVFLDATILITLHDESNSSEKAKAQVHFAGFNGDEIHASAVSITRDL